MKKTCAVVFIAAVIAAGLAGRARAYQFDFAFDAGSDGITINFARGPLPNVTLLPQTIELTGPDDPPQKLWVMPGLYAELSIASIDPVKPQLTLHYVISGGLVLNQDQEGDITLPFEHGCITNRFFYKDVDPGITYDAYGSVNVALLRSSYALQFGLSDLNGLFTAQAAPGANEIHQTITRDSGLQFADVNLVFHPRLLYNKIDFNITMTPQSATWPDPDTATFAGTLPIPYGSYHFWLYRDSKN